MVNGGENHLEPFSCRSIRGENSSDRLNYVRFSWMHFDAFVGQTAARKTIGFRRSLLQLSVRPPQCRSNRGRAIHLDSFQFPYLNGRCHMDPIFYGVQGLGARKSLKTAPRWPEEEIAKVSSSGDMAIELTASSCGNVHTC